MRRHKTRTIMLVHIEGDRAFFRSHAFEASGGVLEDPATGAAAAAFAGYTADRNWPMAGNSLNPAGRDMEAPIIIEVQLDK